MDGSNYLELSNKIAILEERVRNLDDKFVTNADYNKDRLLTDAKILTSNAGVPHPKDWDELSDKVIKLEAKVFELESKIGTKVSTTEFSPIRTLVYGAVGLLLVGVLGGLMRLLIK